MQFGAVHCRRGLFVSDTQPRLRLRSLSHENGLLAGARTTRLMTGRRPAAPTWHRWRLQLPSSAIGTTAAPRWCAPRSPATSPPATPSAMPAAQPSAGWARWPAPPATTEQPQPRARRTADLSSSAAVRCWRLAVTRTAKAPAMPPQPALRATKRRRASLPHPASEPPATWPRRTCALSAGGLTAAAACSGRVRTAPLTRS